MFARVVECHSEVGRSEQVGNKLENDVLPILQKQPGFVDVLNLPDKINPERLMCISFWNSREDAEEYHRQHYYLITDMLKSVLDSPPTLKTFAVNASTAHCGRQSSLSTRCDSPGTDHWRRSPARKLIRGMARSADGGRQHE